jgi:hypothetical protein
MTPQEICTEYREQLRRLYGDEIADKSQVDYIHGWFFIGIAKRYQDGSCGNAYRKIKVLEMIEQLKQRRR